MLTPAKTDPNRKEELARREEQPTAFGTQELTDRPKDWNPNPGLTKAATDDSQDEQAEEQAKAQAKPQAQGGKQQGNHGGKK